MGRKANLIFVKFLNKIYDDHIGAYASSTAFFTFLSLFPMIMLLLSILPYTPLRQETLLGFIATVMPGSVNYVLEEIVSDLYNASTAVLPITLLFTLWSSAKGSLALLRGLNVIFEVEERRNYFILRLRAMIYTLAMLFMILLLLLGVVFARSIRDVVVLHFPYTRIVFDYLNSVRYLMVPAILWLIFTALYTYLPNAPNKFHWEMPGALFTAVSWYFLSWIFSVFVNTVTFTNAYGSLSTVVVTMLWMYCIFYLILIGAALNCYLREVFTTFASLRRNRRKEKKGAETEQNGDL